LLAALGTPADSDDEEETIRAIVGAMTLAEAAHELTNIRKLLQQTPR
jgi:hypothetical protein